MTGITRWSGVILLALIAGAVSFPSAQAADKAKQKKTIGVSVLALTNPFFKVIVDNMTEEAKKNGWDVLAVSGDFDVAKQQNQVKDFIVKKVDAIVLCPCDSKAIGPVIQEANSAGIPVFTADIACLAPGAKIVSHIATDNLSGGRQAGQAMIEALGGKGKVAILSHPEVESASMRVKGFREVVAEENKKPGSKIEIVADLSAMGAKEKGYKVAEDLMQSHPDLNGIFAVNDPSGLGAVAALEKAGKLKGMAIVTFDGQPEGRQAIKDGKVYALPIQFPDKIGQVTIQTIKKYFDGDEVQPQTLIPTALYKKADADKDPTLK